MITDIISTAIYDNWDSPRPRSHKYVLCLSRLMNKSLHRFCFISQFFWSWRLSVLLCCAHHLLYLSGMTWRTQISYPGSQSRFTWRFPATSPRCLLNLATAVKLPCSVRKLAADPEPLSGRLMMMECHWNTAAAAQALMFHGLTSAVSPWQQVEKRNSGLQQRRCLVRRFQHFLPIIVIKTHEQELLHEFNLVSKSPFSLREFDF